MSLIERISSEKRELESLRADLEHKSLWVSVAEDFVDTSLYMSLPVGSHFQPTQWRYGKLLIVVPREAYPWAHSIVGDYVIEIKREGGTFKFYHTKNVLKEIHKDVFIDFLGDYNCRNEFHFSYDMVSHEDTLDEYISILKKDYRYSEEVIRLILDDLGSRIELKDLFTRRAKQEIKDLVI
jgi:hypothetical protein